ncbi:MAG: aminopeptidase P family protein [bacterium]|nr:aminopeptidase P family protein [bacterium]
MFSSETYKTRRNKLREELGTGLILLPGNIETPMDAFANCYPFRQNDSFLYFSGINISDLFIVIDIDNNTEILFGDDITFEDKIWTGPQPLLADIAEKSGIKIVKTKSELHSTLNKAIHSKRELHFLPNCRSEILIKFSELLNIPSHKINDHASVNLIKSVIAQREIKSDAEIEEIEKALDISYEVYTTLLSTIKPGQCEKYLLGKLFDVVFSHGSKVSFSPILTVKGKTFHIGEYSNILNKGDLLLIDSGAKSPLHYASDITRTYPVSGKFTDRQKVIYNAVLNAQLTAIQNIKPGIYYKDIHIKASEAIVEGLKDIGLMKGNIQDAVEAGAHSLFFPHGLGHMLGLEDHDMEVLGEDYVGYDHSISRSSQFGLSALRLAKKLKENFALTVEPGIYFIPDLIDQWNSENKFAEFINYQEVEKYKDFEGIRIEDDIIVTNDGYRILGSQPIPKDIGDIEERMS